MHDKLNDAIEVVNNSFSYEVKNLISLHKVDLIFHVELQKWEKFSDDHAFFFSLPLRLPHRYIVHLATCNQL